MSKCKININEIVNEKDIAKLSTKQLWYKKRDYCLETCGLCSELDVLKKIYWELRKPK